MSQRHYSTEQVMMTLCAMAYEENTHRFDALLQSKEYATNAEWTVVWGPATSDLTAFSMFVAEHAQSGELAIIIRGSVLSLEEPIQSLIDWVDDLDVFTLKKFTDDPALGHISSGSYSAFHHLENMWDPKTKLSLLEYLKSRSPQQITISGHSLGGMLTSVLTAWLRSKLSEQKIRAYSFAAPTAGDGQFAENVGSVDYYQFWNEWDFVPQGFAETSMLEAIKWYPTPGTTMNLAEKILIDGMVALRPRPNPYTQPAGLGIMIPGQIRPKTSFAAQLAHQHNPNTYLALMEAPQIKFSRS